MNSREAGDRVREWLQSERLEARDVADQQAMLHLHVRYPPTKQGHVFNVVIPKNRNLVLIYSVTRVDDGQQNEMTEHYENDACLLYTSDAADDLLCVDLGGRRII